MIEKNPFGLPLFLRARIALYRLKRVFCRHNYKLLVEQSEPDELCAQVVCPKCRTNFAHFHIPVRHGTSLGDPSKAARERLH